MLYEREYEKLRGLKEHMPQRTALSSLCTTGQIYIFNSFDVRSFDTFRNRILHFFDVKSSPG